jgi:hypothetical protein
VTGLVLLVAGLWWSTDADIRNAEQTGGSFIAHRLVVAVYGNSGRSGINVIFFAFFIVTVVVATASMIGGYNQTRAIRDSLDRSRSRAPDGG